MTSFPAAEVQVAPGDTLRVSLDFDSLPPDQHMKLGFFAATPEGQVFHPKSVDVSLIRDGLESHGGYREDVWALSKFPSGYKGFAAEVGAANGVSTSPTLLLEQHGWTVLCVEPNPQFLTDLKRRKQVALCACSDHDADAETFYVHADNPSSFSALRPTQDHPLWHPERNAVWREIQVRVSTLDRLLAESRFPRLDVLSIDTEGTELDVLKGLDLLKWNPKCLIIESWDEPIEITRYLEPYGYKLADRRHVQCLYLR